MTRRDQPPEADESDRHRVATAIQNNQSRRTFIAATAALASAAVAGCTGTSDGGEENNSSDGMDTTGDDGNGDGDMAAKEKKADIDLLNYALTLEHLENAFYRGGLEIYSDSELKNAELLSAFSGELKADVVSHLKLARDHEAGHVSNIESTVSSLGGDPVGELEYDFGYDSPSGFLETAKSLENVGVSAYAGAAPAIKSNAILSTAAGVHSVEARHASFLNLINSSSPYPDGVDEARTVEEVFEAAGPFISSEVGEPPTLDTDDEPMARRKMEDEYTNVDVLNYALTLEHLEHAFYRDGLESFSDSELENADVVSGFGDELRSQIPSRLDTIRAHEKAHVDALTGFVDDFGGEPVEEAEYEFGYSGASEFLATAKTLENVGVSAYAGAAATVSNETVMENALGIHSVEARHASFLNELNTTKPYPKAVDESVTIEAGKQKAGQFIVE